MSYWWFYDLYVIGDGDTMMYVGDTIVYVGDTMIYVGDTVAHGLDRWCDSLLCEILIFGKGHQKETGHWL